MVQITIDTERDSPVSLQHIVRLIQEELRRRGSHPPSLAPYEPMKVEPSSIPSSSSSSSFSDMFGSSSSNSSSDMFAPKETSSSTSSSTPDMFSVFNHDAPKQEMPSYETSSYVDEHMTSQPLEEPTASRLLVEDEVFDTTKDLARRVIQKGTTREPERPFNIEPYE